jgi:hypothetical protein
MSNETLTFWHLSILEERFSESAAIRNASELRAKRITDLIRYIRELPLESSTNYLMDITDPNREDDQAFKEAAQICLEVVATDPPINSTNS